MYRLFPVGVPVRGKDLVGRDDILKQLIEFLKIGQHIVLIGPRRIGKTSIILELCRKLEKDYLIVYIDIFRISSLKELSLAIVDAIFENQGISRITHKIGQRVIDLVKKIELKGELDDLEVVLKLADESDENVLFERALNLLENFAKKRNKQMLVVFDEFGDIQKLDGDKTLKKMRSIFQMSEHCVYVFTGSQESVLGELFRDKKSAFYNFARIMPVGKLPYKPLFKYIKTKFEAVNIDVGDEAADRIIEKAEQHPYYVQLLCQQIYLEKKADNIETVDIKNVDKIFNALVDIERNYCDLLWEALKKRKNFSKIVKAIAIGKNSYTTPGVEKAIVYYILMELEKMGLIRKQDKRYSLIDPIFKAYILRSID